jgi:predicted transcriptional regulator
VKGNEKLRWKKVGMEEKKKTGMEETEEGRVGREEEGRRLEWKMKKTEVSRPSE